MPIILRHNYGIDLNRIDYAGAIAFTELRAFAAFGARNPWLLKVDAINLVRPGADFDAIQLSALDKLFDRYRALYRKIEFQIYRRSAWICLSSRAEKHVDYWIAGRDLKEGMSSSVRLFNAYADAGDWLMLSPGETQQLEHGEGFAEIAKFDAAPVSALAR